MLDTKNWPKNVIPFPMRDPRSAAVKRLRQEQLDAMLKAFREISVKDLNDGD